MLRILVGFGVLLIALEAMARWGLGFGDPPLSRVDASIEYVNVPGEYRRFGNRVFYNEHSMRSRTLPDADTGRVLVAGDSVIHGTAFLDQSDLATEALDAALPAIWVGNVSAVSWGPENLRKYFREFGWFDAETVFFVFSTHDLDDFPRYCTTLGRDFHTNKPISALTDAIAHHGSRYLQLEPNGRGCRNVENSGERGLKALTALLDEALGNVDRVVVMLHPTVGELSGPDLDKRRLLTETVAATGAEYVDMRTVLQRQDAVFLDEIHIDAAGQQVYFHEFLKALQQGATQG